MIWRRVPPVVSPIDTRSIATAAWGTLRPPTRRADGPARGLARMFSADECLLTDSGTSALTLALRLAVPAGSLVAFPAYACIDVIAAAQRADVRVTLYDMHPDSLSPDVDSVRRMLGKGARALVVAPLFGYPPDMRHLMALADEHDVPLIEDAAQAAGGRISGERLGAFGDISVLSFGRGKGMTTGGGGALLLRGARTSERADLARAELGAARRGVGVTLGLAAQWLLARPATYAVPAAIPALKLGQMVYRPASEPRAMSAAAEAVLPTALAMDDQEVRHRQKRASQILAGIAAGGSRFRQICSSPDARPGYLRLAMLDADGGSRAEPRLGIMRGYPVTLDEHPETRRVLEPGEAKIPGARLLRDRLVTLPTHSRVSAADTARIIEWVRRA